MNMFRRITRFLLILACAVCIAACNNAGQEDDVPIAAVADNTKVPASFIDLLFADQSIPEIGKIAASNSIGNTSIWTNFVLADKLFAEHKNEEAAKVFKDVLAGKNNDPRTVLWCWNSLRQVGVQPDKSELLGVVFEVPVQGATEYLAMYVDKTARYINYSGKVAVWDIHTAKMDSLIGSIMADAGRIVVKDTLAKGRNKAPSNNIRFSFLTTSGIYQTEKSFNELAKLPDTRTALFEKATGVLNEIAAKATGKQGQ